MPKYVLFYLPPSLIYNRVKVGPAEQRSPKTKVFDQSSLHNTLRIWLPPASAVEVIESEPCFCVSV